jgi:hypothetical protein
MIRYPADRAFLLPHVAVNVLVVRPPEQER